MTTETSKNGAITLPRRKFCAYVVHATIFLWIWMLHCLLTVACGLVVWLALALVFGRLVIFTCYAHVSVASSVVNLWYPGGVAQWLGRRSMAGGLSLTCARYMVDR